jgi:hypothetical protein
MKLDPPDAHLRQALRHAPDAEVQAPSELSAQILAAAHRAAADRPARAAAASRHWWPRGATWRLGASGAFASVLMAGVIGLLWRGEPPGPAREDPAAAAPAAAPPLPSTPAAMPLAAERTLREPAGTAASLSLSGQRVAADLATSTASAKVSGGAPPWADAAARGALPTLLQSGARREVDAAWLLALAAHTGGRWQPAEAAQPRDGDALLEWRMGDQALARLWLGPASALWCPLTGPQATCQSAALSAQAAAGMKEKLPR